MTEHDLHLIEIGEKAGWQAGYKAGVKAAAKALKADAKLCDCAALEANECACGAWNDYKDISSARAVEIVRALATEPYQHPSPKP